MSPIYLTFLRSLPQSSSSNPHRHICRRTFFVDAATTKWVKDRGLDHAVEREKNLRPMINIKNLIKSEPSKSLPISIIAQHRGSLMIPTRPIEFIRQYPSIFDEFLPGGGATQPHVRLTEKVLDLDAEEELMYQSDSYRQDVADRLLKLLMLVRINKLPVNVIELLKWDLGLPNDYTKTLVLEYPDYFNIVIGKNSAAGAGDLRDLELVCWRNDLAMSVLEKNNSTKKKADEQLVFPMQFSRGFEMDNKLKKWMDDWQKLPYVSPYENAAHISSKSDEGDKWAVGVLHELLHILVLKKTDRENLLCLGECLGLRSRFKQALHHHPGIFYVSNKIGTYTVVLREGYKRGAIIEDHQLMNMRSQYIHLMNTVTEAKKMISVLGGTTQEKKGVVRVPKGEGEEEEEDDESEEEQEGEFIHLSDIEVECENDDSDEEDENWSDTRVAKHADNNRGRRGRRSGFDVKERSRNAESGRSGGRRARKSEFHEKSPSGNAEIGRPGGRRGRKYDFDVQASSRNAERGRVGAQHPGKSRDAVSSETTRRTQTVVRQNNRQNSRERSSFSQSKRRSLPGKKTRI